VGRILITGMSGTGKSTLLAELNRRSYRTIDTDYDGWTHADGRWDAVRMARLLESADPIAVSGTADNQGEFYDRFDQVVLLSAPLDVILARVAARATNPYGRTPAERDEIAHSLRTVEPLLRRGATVELDGRRPTGELADVVADLLGPTPARGASG
jgi:shikimate kinase